MITRDEARKIAIKKIGKKSMTEVEAKIEAQISEAAAQGRLSTTLVIGTTMADLFESVLLENGFDFKKQSSMGGVNFVVSWL